MRVRASALPRLQGSAERFQGLEVGGWLLSPWIASGHRTRVAGSHDSWSVVGDGTPCVADSHDDKEGVWQTRPRGRRLAYRGPVRHPRGLSQHNGITPREVPFLQYILMQVEAPSGGLCWCSESPDGLVWADRAPRHKGPLATSEVGQAHSRAMAVSQGVYGDAHRPRHGPGPMIQFRFADRPDCVN